MSNYEPESPSPTRQKPDLYRPVRDKCGQPQDRKPGGSLVAPSIPRLFSSPHLSYLFARKCIKNAQHRTVTL